MLFLAKSPSVNKYDLSSLKVIFSGAAPLSHEIQDEVFKRIGNRSINIFQGYGMTELSIAATISNDSDKLLNGTIGKIISGMWAKVSIST